MKNIQLKDNLLFNELDDNLILILEEKTQNFIKIEGIGVFIFKQLIIGKTITEIRNDIISEYDVEEKELELDLNTFQQQLFNSNLLKQ
jgi:hypothetical protein